MPFKRVLHWKLAGNRPSKCSARALRGPCTLLKPSKSTVLSSDFMVFAFREGNAYSIALRRRFASTRRLGRAPVDALRPSWAVFGASWGALGLFFGCFGLPNSPQKSQSLPKSLKIRKKNVSGCVLSANFALLARSWSILASLGALSGCSWVALGEFLGDLGELLARLAALFGRSVVLLAGLEALLEPSRGNM